MKIAIVDNIHLFKTIDGNYYSKSIYNNDFFDRYLEVFENIRVIAKVQIINKDFDTTGLFKINTEKIEIFELPWYRGIKQMLKKIFMLRKVYRKAFENIDGVVLRMTQIESMMSFRWGKLKEKPYIVEMVNDPKTFVDINFLLRTVIVLYTRMILKKAKGISFVTMNYLQEVYISKKMMKEKFFESYSTIDLEINHKITSKNSFFKNDEIKIIHVSNAINNDIKGHKTLLKIARSLKNKNMKIKVEVIGDGDYIETLIKRVKKYKLEDHVEFIGRITSKQQIFNKLRESDLLVLPTKMEGLPRVIIEAMSVGLPVLSTPIAGIPELIEREYLFNPKDYKSFSNKIIELTKKPEELIEMSKKNIEKSKEYDYKIIREKRIFFYNEFKNNILSNMK